MFKIELNIRSEIWRFSLKHILLLKTPLTINVTPGSSYDMVCINCQVKIKILRCTSLLWIFAFLALSFRKCFHSHCVKMSVFGVFLVLIFQHSTWIRRSTLNLRIQSKCEQIRTRKSPNMGNFYAVTSQYVKTTSQYVETSQLICNTFAIDINWLGTTSC